MQESSCTRRTEVVGSAGDDIAVEREHDAANGLLADGYVEEHERAVGRGHGGKKGRGDICSFENLLDMRTLWRYQSATDPIKGLHSLFLFLEQTMRTCVDPPFLLLPC
jgi:hypothetical protein